MPQSKKRTCSLTRMNIQLLNIRQNTIASINEFIQQSNSKDITDIDAYDNRIPTVTGLERLEKLR